MRLKMTKELKFWIDIQLQDRWMDDDRAQLIREALQEFEACGDAMRDIGKSGSVVWRPTQQMRRRLADAQRDALADLKYDL
jgi:hypothetical protein